MPDNADERSLVWYNAKNSTEIKMWTDRLDLFLDRMLLKSYKKLRIKNDLNTKKCINFVFYRLHKSFETTKWRTKPRNMQF